MTSVKSVAVGNFCYSIDQLDEHQLLVGVTGGVNLIHAELDQYRSLIRLRGAVNCVRIYDGYIYLLQYDNIWFLRKYNLDGYHITSWHHDDASLTWLNQFAIHNSIICVPSRNTRKIKRYSLSGEPAGADLSIELSETITCMCSTPAGHLILSQIDTSLLVSINSETGEKRWRRLNLIQPRGITSDNYDHLLVSTGRLNQFVIIDVLKADSGEFDIK